MNKLMVVSLAGLMVVPAIAQDTTPAPTNKAPPAATQPNRNATAPADAKMAAGQISASKLLNESVLNQANESIGDINDVILDNSGKVASVSSVSAASWAWAKRTLRSASTSSPSQRTTTAT